MMGNAQPTGMFVPQIPIPLKSRYVIAINSPLSRRNPTAMVANHALGVFFVRTTEVSLSVMDRKL
jgi:hypothetical protein